MKRSTLMKYQMKEFAGTDAGALGIEIKQEQELDDGYGETTVENTSPQVGISKEQSGKCDIPIQLKSQPQSQVSGGDMPDIDRETLRVLQARERALFQQTVSQAESKMSARSKSKKRCFQEVVTSSEVSPGVLPKVSPVNCQSGLYSQSKDESSGTCTKPMISPVSNSVCAQVPPFTSLSADTTSDYQSSNSFDDLLFPAVSVKASPQASSLVMSPQVSSLVTSPQASSVVSPVQSPVEPCPQVEPQKIHVPVIRDGSVSKSYDHQHPTQISHGRPRLFSYPPTDLQTPANVSRTPGRSVSIDNPERTAKAASPGNPDKLRCKHLDLYDNEEALTDYFMVLFNDLRPIMTRVSVYDPILTVIYLATTQ